MEVTVNNVNDCVREMTVTMSQEELAPHFEKAYKEAAPALEIKGFRKGRVPMHMIKKMFGPSIEYQAVEEITNDVFRTEIESRNGAELSSLIAILPGPKVSSISTSA